jgi:hypothetical protein
MNFGYQVFSSEASASCSCTRPYHLDSYARKTVAAAGGVDVLFEDSDETYANVSNAVGASSRAQAAALEPGRSLKSSSGATTVLGPDGGAWLQLILAVCSSCTSVFVHIRRILLPGLATRSLVSSTRPLRYSVPVYPYALAASASLAWPLVPIQVDWVHYEQSVRSSCKGPASRWH